MTNFEYYINSVDHISFSSAVVGENQVVLGFDSDPLIKTAIMHAQFESIHSFLDGNGRMGRILIVLSTMQDKLIETPVFFVSEELEKERIRYYNLLNGTRGSKPDWYSWIEFFLDASDRMALSMLEKLDSITNLAEEGLIAIDSKGNSTIERVWLSAFKKPFVTVQEIAENLNIAAGTARSHLIKLVDLKLIDVDKSKTKNKLYVNYDLLRLL